jgi:hypothetical protein
MPEELRAGDKTGAESWRVARGPRFSDVVDVASMYIFRPDSGPDSGEAWALIPE